VSARLLLVVACLAVVAPATARAAATDLRETRRAQLSPRLMELGFSTDALPAETNVRVLLPSGYAADPARRYPVLYLLHGCCDADVDGSQAWTTHGEVEEATNDLDLIVVMPAGGQGGFYSDWVAAGTRGRPQWERYHMGQLMPWVDANLRTVARREGRVIAGLSMGGYGAMKYAATYPDRFLAAASFSGAVDTNYLEGTIGGVLPGLDGGNPTTVWGPRVTNELNWRTQNPVDIAENLRPLQLTLRTGDGRSGPLDDGAGVPYDPIEGAVHENSVSLHRAFDRLSIAHTWDDYGGGTHTWPYWARSLRQTLPGFMAILADPPAPPAEVTYRSARPVYEAYGFRVAFARDGLAWSKLVDASASAFTLEGAGTADVRMPASTDPASAVTVDGAPVAVAVQEGRLTVPVALGGDGRARVRLVTPATRPRRCTSRRVVVVTVPRTVRGARATLAGRRLAVRDRRIRIDLRGRRAGTYRLVVRGRDAKGRAVVLRRAFRTCA
jgi:S-formylglutathione hydrolase FrmB